MPDEERGFRIRVELMHTSPPVWRRVEVAGDLSLLQLHEVMQAAMGWVNSHLHCFRTGNDADSVEFITEFGRSEGDEGPLENDVRLDQVVSAAEDRLWYDYDFGDGWTHELQVEEVLASPPSIPRCITGEQACPPEDCGGIGGHHELAEWVRSGFSDDLTPEVFADAGDGLRWLPDGWHPDSFDLEEVNERLAAAVAEPIPVVEELASLLELDGAGGPGSLRAVLSRPASHGSTEFTDEEVAELTAAYRILLETIGDGTNLTGAGYLKPALVEQIAQRTGLTEWWIGKANREDQTPQVASLRATARSLGLVSVRKGRLATTRAVKGLADDPERLLHHIIGRLPLGKTDADRHAGWVSLAVTGSEASGRLLREQISEVMFGLGWRDGRDGIGLPPAQNPTLEVLRLLGGELQTARRRTGMASVAAVARAAMRP